MTLRKRAMPAGKPFQKGDDPRRNKGTGSGEAKSFGIRFNNALASGGNPKELSTILWDRARRGQEWAISIILDRLIGKPKENEGQPRAYVVAYADDDVAALLGPKEGKA